MLNATLQDLIRIVESLAVNYRHLCNVVTSSEQVQELPNWIETASAALGSLSERCAAFAACFIPDMPPASSVMQSRSIPPSAPNQPCVGTIANALAKGKSSMATLQMETTQPGRIISTYLKE